MRSVWTDTVELPSFKTLDGDIKTDVLIIGGGLAGLLTAYMLQKEGVEYVLVEAEEICSGITKNTTAKITSQHGLIYADLIHRFGKERTKLYLEANQRAIEEYAGICAEADCGFETRDSYVYSLNDPKKIEREVEALHKIGFEAEFHQKLPLPFPVAAAVKFKEQAQFHPLKFTSHIAKGLSVYEHTMVKEITPGGAITQTGSIKAERIVVATHFPFINRHGGYFLKMYQSRSYVTAVENAADVDGMYVDEDDKGMSFRNWGNLLLIGGGGHRTGKQGGCWQELHSFAKRYYPQAKEKYCWATQDCMTLDKVPYIGLYSKRTPNLYVITGFNKWGMTSSMAGATMLADMLKGRDNPYEAVFRPYRGMLRPQLGANALEATLGLVNFSTRRCPHLGCKLNWNKNEHSWDCSCHGSRFSHDGELIDNPAMKGLKERE